MLECKIDPDHRSRRCSQRHSFTLLYLSLSSKAFYYNCYFGYDDGHPTNTSKSFKLLFFLTPPFPTLFSWQYISFCFSLFFVLFVIVALLSSNFQNNNQLFNVNPPYKLQKSEIKKNCAKKSKGCAKTIMQQICVKSFIQITHIFPKFI